MLPFFTESEGSVVDTKGMTVTLCVLQLFPVQHLMLQSSIWVQFPNILL